MLMTLLSTSVLLMGFAKRNKKVACASLNGKYELVSYKKGLTLKLVSNNESTIQIDTKEHTISCNVGCNTISGEFKTTGKKIAPLQLLRTEMYCVEVAELEQQFIENLNQVSAYKLKGNTLTLLHEQNTLLVLKRK